MKCPIFDAWGIDFIGPFPVSNAYSNILLVVDYVSRWVEAITTKTNDAKVVVDFLKSNIFCWFGVLKVLISDQGSHFYNRAMSSLLHKYGVVYRVATAYQPQTNDQAKVFNKEIKKTLQKMSRLLEDALWAHKTAYRTSLRMSPYQIIFDKACYLPPTIKPENKGSSSYKNWTNSAWKPMRTPKSISKLHSRWYEPFVITNVNGRQIKLFHEGPAPIVDEMENNSLMEPALLDDTP
ncbi:pol, partial [Mucuna pruriens]